MKIANLLFIIFFSLFLASCTKVVDPAKKIGLGIRSVNYQADENVDSLVIPPDLTFPSAQGEFIEIIESDKNIGALDNTINSKVQRDQYRRWLVVDVSTTDAWSLSKEFLRSAGFVIEKENKKIGLMETNYLEMSTNVPDKSLGLIRSTLSKALQTQYGLPVADKYRIRIEPTNKPNQSEIYLTLSSIGEVISGSQRVWQPREKDVELEMEMLLSLMIFIGNDKNESIDQIANKLLSKSEKPMLELTEDGYSIIVFPYEKKQTWSLLGWALDELNIDIDDRDPIDGSYFINATLDDSFISKILSKGSASKKFQLVLVEETSLTKVFFVDLSEENNEKTVSYSSELFTQIASKF